MLKVDVMGSEAVHSSSDQHQDRDKPVGCGLPSRGSRVELTGRGGEDDSAPHDLGREHKADLVGIDSIQKANSSVSCRGVWL